MKTLKAKDVFNYQWQKLQEEAEEVQEVEKLTLKNLQVSLEKVSKNTKQNAIKPLLANILVLAEEQVEDLLVAKKVQQVNHLKVQQELLAEEQVQEKAEVKLTFN